MNVQLMWIIVTVTLSVPIPAGHMNVTVRKVSSGTVSREDAQVWTFPGTVSFICTSEVGLVNITPLGTRHHLITSWQGMNTQNSCRLSLKLCSNLALLLVLTIFTQSFKLELNGLKIK